MYNVIIHLYLKASKHGVSAAAHELIRPYLINIPSYINFNKSMQYINQGGSPLRFTQSKPIIRIFDMAV